MLVVMKTGYVEKLAGGTTRTYSAGLQYSVDDELGQHLCASGAATAAKPKAPKPPEPVPAVWVEPEHVDPEPTEHDDAES